VQRWPEGQQVLPQKRSVVQQSARGTASKHDSPAPQALPQEPQLRASPRMFVQTPPQVSKPGRHPGTHDPPKHDQPIMQARPQLPQWFAS
jgi:hypothetical protein